jgi:hypothetical protein
MQPGFLKMTDPSYGIDNVTESFSTFMLAPQHLHPSFTHVLRQTGQTPDLISIIVNVISIGNFLFNFKG